MRLDVNLFSFSFLIRVLTSTCQWWRKHWLLYSETSDDKQLTAGESGFLSTSSSAAPPQCQVVCSHDLLVNGKTLIYSRDPSSSSTPTFGDKNIQLEGTDDRTLLVDIKLEPALEGYDIYHLNFVWAKSHHYSLNNSGLEDWFSTSICLSKPKRHQYWFWTLACHRGFHRENYIFCTENRSKSWHWGL